MDGRAIRVTDVGWKARGLVDGAVSASVVAALSRSVYLDVAGEIVWLGPAGSTLHSRAIIADALPAVEAHSRVDLTFDLTGAREWRPPALAPSIDVGIIRAGGRRLVGAIDRLGPPDGFGALLVGRRPPFPLDRAEEDARRFLTACARGEAKTALTLAERLLGLGPGLTPAGDDLIGGAFFLIALTSPRAHDTSHQNRGAPRLRRGASERVGGVGGHFGAPHVIEAIRARAAERTHRISAALLGDLLDGDSYAPLHDLAGALTRDDAGAALDAAARLIRIGHSSGWDMLAGFLGALDTLPAPR